MGNVNTAQQQLCHNVMDKIECEFAKTMHDSKFIPFTRDCNKYNDNHIDMLYEYGLNKECQNEYKDSKDNYIPSVECAKQFSTFIGDENTFLGNCYTVLAEKLKTKDYALFKNKSKYDHTQLCATILKDYKQELEKAEKQAKEQHTTQCVLKKLVFEDAFAKNKKMFDVCTGFTDSEIYLCKFPESGSSCTEIMKKTYKIEVECDTNTPPTCKLKRGSGSGSG